jgi:uncharacterized protein
MNDVLKIFIIVTVTWIITELIKISIDLIKIVKKRNTEPLKLFHYGGMPSTHSTFVTTLSLSIFLVEGFTTSFILSLALWILVIRDILAIRTHIDLNSKHIKQLSKGKLKNISLSHTIPEIIVGITLSSMITIVLYLVI